MSTVAQSCDGAAFETPLVQAPPPSPPPSTQITIDASKPDAAFDFLYGVDHGPLCDSGVDVSEELRSMGATLIRTHDSGVLDWPVV